MFEVARQCSSRLGRSRAVKGCNIEVEGTRRRQVMCLEDFRVLFVRDEMRDERPDERSDGWLRAAPGTGQLRKN